MGFGLASLWVLWGWGIFVCVLQLPQNDLPSTGSWGRQNPLPRAGWGAQLWGRAWLRPALHANKSKTIYIMRWPHPPSLSYKLWACAQDIFFVYEMMVSRRKKKKETETTHTYTGIDSCFPECTALSAFLCLFPCCWPGRASPLLLVQGFGRVNSGKNEVLRSFSSWAGLHSKEPHEEGLPTGGCRHQSHWTNLSSDHTDWQGGADRAAFAAVPLHFPPFSAQRGITEWKVTLGSTAPISQSENQGCRKPIREAPLVFVTPIIKNCPQNYFPGFAFCCSEVHF